MDWPPTPPLFPFEPNLKFAADLRGDLKTKYLEQHEMFKRTLENYTTTLLNLLHDYHSKCIPQYPFSYLRLLHNLPNFP